MANLLATRSTGEKVHQIPEFESKEVKVKRIKTTMKTVVKDGIEKDEFDFATVTLDLDGLGAWVWDKSEDGVTYRKIIDEIDVVVKNNQNLYEKGMNWYQGYYAEVPTNGSPNRQLGCFGKVIFSYAPVTYEDPTSGKVEYGRTRKFYLRDTCDEHITTFRIPMEHLAAFLDAVRKEPQLKVREETQAGNYMEVMLDVAECPFKKGGCIYEEWMRTTHYSNVHIANHLRNETQEEAGTTIIRMLAAAAAGIIMKMRHPAWNKPGLYLAKGYEPDEIFKYTQDRFQTCANCLMHKSIGMEQRDNSEDGILGQAGIGTQKSDGQDPIHFCMFKNEWLRLPWEMQQDMNMAKIRHGASMNQGSVTINMTEIRPDANSNQKIVVGVNNMEKALQASVCDHFMWNYRFNNSGAKRDQGRDYACKMAYNKWTSAARFVEFKDHRQILAEQYNPAYGTTLKSLDEANPEIIWDNLKLGDKVIVRKSRGGTQLDTIVDVDTMPFLVSKVPGFTVVKENLHETYLKYLRRFGN